MPANLLQSLVDEQPDLLLNNQHQNITKTTQFHAVVLAFK